VIRDQIRGVEEVGEVEEVEEVKEDDW